jgi:hypothetical protein
MSVSLTEALRDVDLQPGQTYRCEVRGQNAELRVLAPEANGDDAESAIPAAEVMLEPWLELPELACRANGFSRLTGSLPPDIPAIPHDGEDA